VQRFRPAAGRLVAAAHDTIHRIGSDFLPELPETPGEPAAPVTPPGGRLDLEAFIPFGSSRFLPDLIES